MSLIRSQQFGSFRTFEVTRNTYPNVASGNRRRIFSKSPEASSKRLVMFLPKDFVIVLVDTPSSSPRSYSAITTSISFAKKPPRILVELEPASSPSFEIVASCTSRVVALRAYLKRAVAEERDWERARGRVGLGQMMSEAIAARRSSVAIQMSTARARAPVFALLSPPSSCTLMRRRSRSSSKANLPRSFQGEASSAGIAA